MLAQSGWHPKTALVAITAAAAAGAMGTGWYLTRPGTFDECLLAEMRGQPTTMTATVRAVCARRFGVEQSVDLLDGFNWLVLKDGRVSVVPTRQSLEFAVTRASFRFSAKQCRESSDVDYSAYMTRTASKNQFFEFDPPAGLKPLCMQWKDVRGRYY
jgi:hypothetical protein